MCKYENIQIQTYEIFFAELCSPAMVRRRLWPLQYPFQFVAFAVWTNNSIISNILKWRNKLKGEMTYACVDIASGTAWRWLRRWWSSWSRSRSSATVVMMMMMSIVVVTFVSVTFARLMMMMSIIAVCAMATVYFTRFTFAIAWFSSIGTVEHFLSDWSQSGHIYCDLISHFDFQICLICGEKLSIEFMRIKWKINWQTLLLSQSQNNANKQFQRINIQFLLCDVRLAKHAVRRSCFTCISTMHALSSHYIRCIGYTKSDAQKMQLRTFHWHEMRVLCVFSCPINILFVARKQTKIWSLPLVHVLPFVLYFWFNASLRRH